MKILNRHSVIYCASAILAFSVSAKADSAPQQTAPMVMTDQADNTSVPGIDQFSVAQRITLDTIPATDPSLTKALAADNLEMAAKWLGYNGSFQGTVAKVYVTPDKRTLMLDFNPDFHKAACALLKMPDYAQFPDMRTLTGKHLLITGRWVAHKNQLVIQLFKPSQIKIIQDATATKPIVMPNTATVTTASTVTPSQN